MNSKEVCLEMSGPLNVTEQTLLELLQVERHETRRLRELLLSRVADGSVSLRAEVTIALDGSRSLIITHPFGKEYELRIADRVAEFVIGAATAGKEGSTYCGAI